MTNDQLEKLYLKYNRELYLYAISLCRNHHQAEDLASETFFKALLSLNEDTPYIKYWLFSVCKNLFLDNVKTQKEYNDIDNFETLLATEKTPLDKIIDDEGKNKLYHLVMNLRPSSYREIIVLYYYCDFNLKEIVEITGLNMGAAKALLFRARKKLKTELEGKNEI